MRNKTIAILFCVLFIISYNKTLYANNDGICKDTSVIKTLLKPKITGTINIGVWYNQKGGTAPNALSTQKLDWFIQGQPTITIANMSFPFSGVYSNNDFNYSQPFNQYGLSPSYKWATAHMGYRNLAFGSYTLSGATFLGGGLELNPGKFRFAAFYGRFNRAIEEDTNILKTAGVTIIPAYKRIGYGVKLGIGSDVNFIDFSFVKIQDDTASIHRPTLNTISPSDNLLVGISNKLKFGKHFKWESEGAYSIYTEDQQAFGNEIQQKVPQFARSIVSLNISTTLNPAYKMMFGFGSKIFDITAQYEYIGPNYRSLAMYYIQNDVVRYTVNPSLRIWQNKINLSGSYGLQEDNLSKLKLATTLRLVKSLNISLTPMNRINIQANYSNFGTTQSSGKIQLNDSIRISQINASYGGTVSLLIPSKGFPSNITMNITQQSVNDLNVLTQKFSKSDVFLTTFNYGLTISKLKLNVNIGIVRAAIQSYSGDVVNAGPSFSASTSLFKNKCRINLGSTYQDRRINGKSDGSIFTISSGFNFIVFKKQIIGIRYQYTLNTTTTTSIYYITQNRLGFTYGYSF